MGVGNSISYNTRGASLVQSLCPSINLQVLCTLYHYLYHISHLICHMPVMRIIPAEYTDSIASESAPLIHSFIVTMLCLLFVLRLLLYRNSQWMGSKPNFCDMMNRVVKHMVGNNAYLAISDVYVCML
jgi:hypothetical protein